MPQPTISNQPNAGTKGTPPPLHTLLSSVMQELYRDTPREWRTTHAEYDAHSGWPSHTLQTMLHTLNATRDSIRSERESKEEDERQCEEKRQERFDYDAGYYDNKEEERRLELERIDRARKEERETMVLCPNWLTNDWMNERQHVRYEENKILFDNCQVLISYIQTLEECPCVYCEI